MKMAELLILKNLVKHIANDRLGDLCLLCLTALEKSYSENIFSLICREDSDYCVADALEAVCQFKFDKSENYNVCIDCFKSATEAYKFHLQAKRSMELITQYTNELFDNVKNVEITSDDMEKLLFVPLPEYTPKTKIFEFSLDGVGRSDNSLKEGIADKKIEFVHKVDSTLKLKSNLDSSLENGGSIADSNFEYNSVTDTNDYSSTADNIDEEVGQKSMLATDFDMDQISRLVDRNNDDTENNSKGAENIILLVEKEDEDENANCAVSMQSSDDDMVVIVNEKKARKQRDPMEYMTCNHCPIKYRFVAKLKQHMKTVHNIVLYYCKICKKLTENKEEYEEHLKTHTDKYQCTICNTVYKKAETLATHMLSHEKSDSIEKIDNGNICEQCGALFESEESLERHVTERHTQRYTCYYCGRRYRGELSFEGHVRKHEEYWARRQGSKTSQASEKAAEKQGSKRDKSKRSVCQTCGRDFVDERSLLWHQRLHDNDRPFVCDVCGRGFVSRNRRNQHALCAHTAPQRRCPLCPALFHLRSMVNTHVKKVHLKAHKRRNRTSKHQHVSWRTQPVPIQELSIDVQHDVLEIKAARGDQAEPGSYASSTSLFA